MKENNPDHRIAQILDLILKLEQSDFKASVPVSGKDDDLDVIINRLNKLGEKLESKLFIAAEQERRINELVEVLLQYTLMDFSRKIEISDKGDELDAIAVGLNTLGEELDSHIQLLQANTAEILEQSEQLLKSNRQMEQFAYITSHDLQEPLRTLINYSGLLQREQPLNPDGNFHKYLKHINTASKRMQSLITDLLEYSRVGKDRTLTELNCNAVVQEVMEDLATVIKESKAEIIVGPLPVINAYAELKSLFQNLISNAIKFRKSNESLVIHITAKEQKEEWLFATTDNGIGIEKKYHERIFSIFQKLHSPKEYAGTGIGLAQCKKIVDLNGGAIWIESEPEKGSTFYFTIPQKITK